jgi:hypothetical protein
VTTGKVVGGRTAPYRFVNVSEFNVVNGGSGRFTHPTVLKVRRPGGAGALEAWVPGAALRHAQKQDERPGIQAMPGVSGGLAAME